MRIIFLYIWVIAVGFGTLLTYVVIDTWIKYSQFFVGLAVLSSLILTLCWRWRPRRRRS